MAKRQTDEAARNDGLAMERLVFTEEQLSRITKKYTNGKLVVKVDLHGLRHAEAKRFVKNLIVMNRGPFELDVIHGYNRGVVLKKMAGAEDLSSRIIKRECLVTNLGLTKLSIAQI